MHVPKDSESDPGVSPLRTPCECGALANALRARTRDLRAKAERTGIIGDILRQRVELHGYSLLLRNLLPVYREIEKGLRRHRHTRDVGLLCQPAVFRAPAMESDRDALCGKEWERSLPFLSAADSYVHRVARGGG